jgi:hypothetical protein
MKISQINSLGYEKFLVKLNSNLTPENDIPILKNGDKLLTVEEYHRLLNEDDDILLSVTEGRKIIETNLFKINSPFEISEYNDERDNIIYSAYNYKEGQVQLEYILSQKIGSFYSSEYLEY